jgi:hypothetical protein
MAMHTSDEDLELYHLGAMFPKHELVRLEQHLLFCPECARRAEESATYVDAMRAAIIIGNFDLAAEAELHQAE